MSHRHAIEEEDPYRDLELYLQKAQEEIGRVFEKDLPPEDEGGGGGGEKNGRNKLVQLESVLHDLSGCPSSAGGRGEEEEEEEAHLNAYSASVSGSAKVGEVLVVASREKSSTAVDSGSRREGAAGLKRRRLSEEEPPASREDVRMPTSVATLPFADVRRRSRRYLRPTGSSSSFPRRSPCSLKGGAATGGGSAKNVSSSVISSSTTCDVNALSLWADNLVREMNSISSSSDEDIVGGGSRVHSTSGVKDDDETRTSENGALLWWLLTDLPTTTEANEKVVGEGGMGNCVSCSNEDEESSTTAAPPIATKDDDKYEPDVAGDSESEEVFVDALEYPPECPKTSNTNHRGRDLNVQRVEVTIRSPLELKWVRRHNSTPDVDSCCQDDDRQHLFRGIPVAYKSLRRQLMSEIRDRFSSSSLPRRHPPVVPPRRHKSAVDSSSFPFPSSSPDLLMTSLSWNSGRSVTSSEEGCVASCSKTSSCSSKERLSSLTSASKEERDEGIVRRSKLSEVKQRLFLSGIVDCTSTASSFSTPSRAACHSSEDVARKKQTMTEVSRVEKEEDDDDLWREDEEQQDALSRGIVAELVIEEPTNTCEEEEEEEEQEPKSRNKQEEEREEVIRAAQVSSSPRVAAPSSCFEGGQRSRLSSSTSTASSSGSQMKPADVQDFIRRVETSIWQQSSSLPRRQQETLPPVLLQRQMSWSSASSSSSGTGQLRLCANSSSSSIGVTAEIADDSTSKVQHAATQTSPALSRSSSFIWMGEGEINGLAANGSEESVLSFSCSSVDGVTAAGGSDSSESSWYCESDPSVESEDVAARRGMCFTADMVRKRLSQVLELSGVSSCEDEKDGSETNENSGDEVDGLDGSETDREITAFSGNGEETEKCPCPVPPTAKLKPISLGSNIQILKVYTPYQVPREDVWVRREDVCSQTMSRNGYSADHLPSIATSEDSSVSEDTAYQSAVTPTLAKSASEISSKWSISPSGGGSVTRNQFHERTVRETHSDSNISEFKIHLAIEDKLTVRSKRVVPNGSCCTGSSSPTANGTFTIPPSKVRPLLLRNLSSTVSAPSSTLSSPMSDDLPPLPRPPSTPPCVPVYRRLPTRAGLSILDIANKSSSAPILDERCKKRSGGGGDASPAISPETPSTGSDSSRLHLKVVPPPRSQSVKELTELEAVEACKWLRAAGFPQYAQMFEDMQFPINIAAVQKDHYFLDDDSIQSLFRRLNALNRCARMRLDSIPRKSGIDDSDEEEQCAISENWTFQRQSRRWSRIPSALESCIPQSPKSDAGGMPALVNGQMETTTDSVFVDSAEFHQRKTANGRSKETMEDCDIPESPIPMEDDGSGGSASLGSLSTQAEDGSATEARPSNFRRTGSERLRDGARAFLRRMESLKTRRSKRRNREAVVISGPHVVDLEGMQQRMHRLACVDLTPPSSTTPSPQLTHHRSASDGRAIIFDDSSSLNSASDTSQNSTPTTQSRNRRWGCVQNHHHHHRPCSDPEKGAFSDSECSPPLWRAHKDANSNDTKLIEHYLHNYSNGFPEVTNSNNVNFRTGSFNLGQESSAYREKLMERRRLKHSRTVQPSNGEGGETKRSSLYDNVPLVICNKTYEDIRGGSLQVGSNHKSNSITDGKFPDEKASLRIGFYQDSDSGSSASTNQDPSDQDSGSQKSSTKENNKNAETTNEQINKVAFNRTTNVNLHWQNTRHSSLMKRPRPSVSACSLPINGLSAGQLMMLRKLSLLKLTALMERYSPSNRSGWSWIMPKFIKRMKNPDYKDKVVFGLPLAVVHQRTGQPLPSSIQAAMLFLRKNAMDSVGLFRKSGVRSRIQKLKNMNEANPHNISYEGQQTYDVADMLKQYYRELPEALLTNKMSETFISIYQYIPEEMRLEALQAAIMLMPDENREVLQKLLSFLSDVSQQSHENQMTASNLAVCFAPSLFHIGTPRSTSSSPRRRKTVGVPDQKELNENRAAHECLTHMIKDYKRLFSVPEDTMFQCRFSYIDESEPVTLDDLGRNNGNEFGDWQKYIACCIQNVLKESRDKFKGWISTATFENADVAFKKVGDGNPLRLWKVSVEVEAPPIELLNRVLRERHLWDNQLLKWRVVSRLDSQSEVFQYVRNAMPPLPARDYCILRSWRTDLPKGTCVLVEASVHHPDTPLLLGDVRGIVLMSRYLIEPCGSGKSRMTHISRVDTRGRSPEWYNRVYGHISALHLVRICDSFRHSTDGPESKV